MDNNNNICDSAPPQSDGSQSEQVSGHVTTDLSNGGTEINNNDSQQEVIRSEEDGVITKKTSKNFGSLERI